MVTKFIAFRRCDTQMVMRRADGSDQGAGGCAVSANVPGFLGSGGFTTGPLLVAEPVTPGVEAPPEFAPALIAEDPLIALVEEP